MAAARSVFKYMVVAGLAVMTADGASASPPIPTAAETARTATAGPNAAAPAAGVRASSILEPPPLPTLPEANGTVASATAPPDVPAPSSAAASEAEGPGLLPAPPAAPGETAGRAAQPPLLPSATAAGPEPDAPASSGGEKTVETAPPASRLLRMLRDGPAPGAEAGPPPGLPGMPTLAVDPVVSGCPRGMLTALLAGATERTDAVSALAIERETLTLCRERQEIVTRIFQLEAELTALPGKPEDSPATAAPVPAGEAAAAPRVISQLGSLGGTGQSPPSRKAAEPPPRSYAWFSIIGTPGRLRAGVSDGMRAWFVREGDRLPGAGVVERIAARPPGVHAGGTALPYGPRPSGDGP